MRVNSSNSNGHVGNDFIVPIKTSNVVVQVNNESTATIPVKFTHSLPNQVTSTNFNPSLEKNKPQDIIYNHSIVAFALLILAIALVSRPIIDKYLYSLPVQPIEHAKDLSKSGLNIAVTKPNLQTWLNSYESQPATINLGSQTIPISQSTLKSWLNIEAGINSDKYNVHFNTALMSSSLSSLANQYVSTPVNQVVATRSDGTSETAVFGQNGSKLSNPSAIVTQAESISKNIFSNKGFQISAPLVSVPYQNITPTAFNKLILVDVNSKKMYLYQNGQLVNTYLVSAGAPATPTPIGEFHIYEKLPLQNMSGFNPNGTPYFQPNVEWVNYFDGSDAVHGVYWHPLSWFGVHNSSHGCVGIPDDEAESVYNWAPIGTTVITTPN